MSFHSWLQSLRSALAPGRGRPQYQRRGSLRAASYRPNLDVLEDRLTPSFGPAVAYPVGLDQVTAVVRDYVVAGDFNNDGHLDLATSNQNGTVSVLLGDGRGGFGAARQSALGASPWSMAIGDFDGDGNLDLVTADQSLRYVSFLLGNGDGTFRPPITYDTRYDFYLTSAPVSMAVKDYSGGASNLVFGTHAIPFALDEGSYNESAFVEEVSIDGGHWTSGAGDGIPYGLAVADLNASGNPDVVTVNDFYDYWTASYYGEVVVHLDGGGTYVSETHPHPRAVTVGDFTGDGSPDLVIDGQILPGSGGVSFGSPIGSFAGAPAAVADFNGDGRADIDSSGGVFLSLGDGTFTEPIYHGGSPAVGDFNGDGRPDVAVRAGNTVRVQLNDGDWPLPPNPPAIRVSAVSVTEGNTGTTAANFIVTLSAPSTETITVEYATADGSATAGNDYQAASGTLTFAPGETSKTVTVLVNGDRVAELNETFFVLLSNPTNATVNGVGVGTIVDDEPYISIGSSVSGSEGNTGQTPFAFTVTLSSAYDAPVTVTYATADGSATAGSDYQAASGTLTFAPGETSKTITVQVIGDHLAEPTETFIVHLSSPTNAVIADYVGVGTILDDEPKISIGDAKVTEGNTGTVNATFTLTLSSASDVDVTVHYATENMTAVAGSDYVGASGNVVIPAGRTTATFTVQVIGDRLAEPNENFAVNLSAAWNATIADGQGVATILDDEPRISISDVAKREGRNGKTTLFTFSVTLSAAYDQSVTMSFRTVDGTATTSDNDYVAQTGTITLNPGETTKTITIEVKGDSKKEADETFYLDLFGNSGNSLFTRSRGTGTILNDD